MDLCKFLHTNKYCPVCQEPLTLYLQVIDGTMWQAKQIGSTYHFEQFKCKNKKLANDDAFSLQEKEGKLEVEFKTNAIQQNAKSWQFFFFYMCNVDAIEDETSINYGINPYVACYYHSTHFLDFKKNESTDRWNIYSLSELDSSKENATRDEIFVFKSPQSDGEEKVYILSSDYETKLTSLRFYSIPFSERANKNYDPNIFTKELPLLTVRPNFDLSQREQLLQRLSGWIILS